MTDAATSAASDPAHDVLRGPRSSLAALFTPRSVAVVGASEQPGRVGRTLLNNLIRNPFGGIVYPINPKRPQVLGIRAYASLAALPEPVELAVIATPAPTVPDVIRDCVATGVRGAIVISAGFKEAGPKGVELERQILEVARPSGLRIIGPNCLGLMNPLTGLNATFAGAIARPGKVAFLSQSGALCTAILDWSLREQVGFSAFVSLGSMLDVSWGDLIDHLGDDPRTESILLYMETIGDARSFLSAAREVALAKPIIAIKPGRTAAAAKAAASHTGALTGSDEVLDAAFRRAGVLRVDTVADLFSMAEVLGKQPRPRGKRLTIVTNAGGPGVLATDALLAAGGALAEVPDDIKADLDKLLPPQWSHGNPIDVLGDADPDRFVDAIAIASRNADSDGLLAILTPQDMTDPTQTAAKLAALPKQPGKPIVAAWMGGAAMLAGEDILNRADIPTFAFPDAAAGAFNYLWQYAENLRSLYETPTLTEAQPIDRAAVAASIEQARSVGRTLLTEAESKQILAAYGIPTIPTRVAATADDAVRVADELGYPVAVKLHSLSITHKTDVGGVKLNVGDSAAVRRAFAEIEASIRQKVGAGFDGVSVQPMIDRLGYELILGSSLDPQFGPVLLFGAGGQLVEVFADRALGLPPLTATLARRLMERTKIYRALFGVRGRRGIDLAALEQILVRFSQLVVEQPWIVECDINPLLAAPEQLVALDARFVLQGANVAASELPRPAIRPYPTALVTPWNLKDGTPVILRPIRPEDEPELIRFHETLSEQSVHRRFFQPLKLSRRVAHERLARVCFNDYDRELALVAEHRDPATGAREILGIGRLSRHRGGDVAEFAILIGDRWQGKGLGTELLRRLVAFGCGEGLSRIVADILPENVEMQSVAKKLGFTLRQEPTDHLVRAEVVVYPPKTG